MTAIGMGWGITWLSWSSDYTRFIRPETPERKVFWSTFLGIFVPTVWLGFLGASIASAGTGGRPGRARHGGVRQHVDPDPVPRHARPIATNILNLYSATLAALSLDIKVARWKVALVVSAVGTIALIAFIPVGQLRARLRQLARLGRRLDRRVGRRDARRLLHRPPRQDRRRRGWYDDPAYARYGDINWAAVIATLVGLVAGWSWEYGLVDFMQGPVAKATNNTDLSWLAAFVVSGGLYSILRPILAKEDRPKAAPTPAA